MLSLSFRSLQVGAHYFEEGNVELDAKKEFQDSTIFQVTHLQILDFNLTRSQG